MAAANGHKDRFMDAYTVIQKYLLDDGDKNMAVDPDRREYLKKMMDVTCTGGKYNRGTTVVDVVDVLTVSLTGEAKEKALFEACVCGWMIEMMQAHFLVEDDIMDSSITRRNKPCWYRFPGVTTQSAINDGLIILAWCSELAFKYFETNPNLLALLKQFHRTDYQTTMGQLYDVTSMRASSNINPDVPQELTTGYEEFTMDTFKRIVKYKTSYYTYYLPMTMGVTICKHIEGVDSIKDSIVEKLAMVMGEYFQAQDDFMDCFTDPVALGKIGTDIQDMKCSWLAVNFLKIANADQLAAFKTHYGKHDDGSIAEIKKLFHDSDMKGKFAEYEDSIAASVDVELSALEGMHKPFASAIRILWNKTYKRSK